MRNHNSEEIKYLPDGRIDITQFDENELRRQRKVIMEIDEWCREQEAEQIKKGYYPPGGIQEKKQLEAAGYRWDADTRSRVKVKRANAQ